MTALLRSLDPILHGNKAARSYRRALLDRAAEQRSQAERLAAGSAGHVAAVEMAETYEKQALAVRQALLDRITHLQDAAFACRKAWRIHSGRHFQLAQENSRFIVDWRVDMQNDSLTRRREEARRYGQLRVQIASLRREVGTDDAPVARTPQLRVIPGQLQ